MSDTHVKKRVKRGILMTRRWVQLILWIVTLLQTEFFSSLARFVERSWFEYCLDLASVDILASKSDSQAAKLPKRRQAHSMAAPR